MTIIELEDKNLRILTDAESQKIVAGAGKNTVVTFNDEATAVNYFDTGLVTSCISTENGQYECEIPEEPEVGVD